MKRQIILINFLRPQGFLDLFHFKIIISKDMYFSLLNPNEENHSNLKKLRNMNLIGYVIEAQTTWFIPT